MPLRVTVPLDDSDAPRLSVALALFDAVLVRVIERLPVVLADAPRLCEVVLLGVPAGDSVRALLGDAPSLRDAAALLDGLPERVRVRRRVALKEPSSSPLNSNAVAEAGRELVVDSTGVNVTDTELLPAAERVLEATALIAPVADAGADTESVSLAEGASVEESVPEKEGEMETAADCETVPGGDTADVLLLVSAAVGDCVTVCKGVSGTVASALAEEVLALAAEEELATADSDAVGATDNGGVGEDEPV